MVYLNAIVVLLDLLRDIMCIRLWCARCSCVSRMSRGAAMAGRRPWALSTLWVVILGSLGACQVHAGLMLLEPATTCSLPLFVFGASYMDVGQNSAAMPFRELSEFPPYGIDYFGRPTGRFSNGRLVIDHICQELGQELMSPYLQNMGATFSDGVNFASSGSTAVNSSFIGDGSESQGLFSLYVQVDQFRVFHHQALSQHSQQGTNVLRLPQPDDFYQGVYIMETGNNDYRYGNDLTPLSLQDFVKAVIEHMEHAIRVLHNEGARMFVVFDLFPAECFPARLGHPDLKPSDLNEDGCVAKVANMSAMHNRELRSKLKNLRAELEGVNLVLFSIHDLMMSAVRNPAKFGLKYVHRACCGYGGGRYNYHPQVNCGRGGYIDGEFKETTTCEDRSSYMIWDHLHPTDAFAHHIAKAFVNGEHMEPFLSIKNMCHPLSMSIRAH